MQILTSPEKYKHSWFIKIRDISLQYALPDPLVILKDPPSASSLKHKAQQKVLDYWQAKFRDDITRLDSLKMFKSEFMSLSHPHPIWTSAGSSPFETRKATVQARMLSGRYRTCWFRRHWSGDPAGQCKVPGCHGQPGTLQHIATGESQGLSGALVRATSLWDSFLAQNPILVPIIDKYYRKENFLSFLLDPTTKPEVISMNQIHGKQACITEKLCYLTRTWLFYMHKERLKLLDLWND